MHRRRLLWQIFPSFVLITILSLVAVAWYATNALRRLYRESLKSDLAARAAIFEEHVVDHMRAADADVVDRLCKQLGTKASTRITVILRSGQVIGDSDEDPVNMDNHGDRPEVREALAGECGEIERVSPTLKMSMMYVAIPVRREGQIVGVVRTSIATTAIDEALKAVYGKIALAGLAILLVAAAVSLAASRRISRPIEEMKRGAERFARGDLSGRLPVPGSEELGGLAEAMNRMAAELDERIGTIVRQRNEHEAILLSMIEGVLAIDADERLISMNQAAAQMLQVGHQEVQGKSIQEVVRNADLQRFVEEALRDPDLIEADIVLDNEGERFLQAHGAPLRDGQGKGFGVLVVLNDVTRLRRLENIRKEFVANVSHELKTPITSIKGFVETLQDGALHVAEDAERFLGVIAKQVDRLNAVIEDLLLLSKLEQQGEGASIALEEANMREILEAAAQLCSLKAGEKQIRVDVKCEEEFVAAFNPPLLEQAVVNLVDNAIKYSEAGRSVEVTASRTEDEIAIRCRDWGCGIAGKHLPRLFERFYRVDKARSRKLGGTGLGLAIVKHIAQAHGGRVEVDSQVGKGSLFTIRLPRV